MSDPSRREWIPARPWLVALILIGAALAIIVPIFQFPQRWGDPYDWRYFETMEEVYRATVSRFGQLPLWNPWTCGGQVALANPQSTVAAPTFLLSLLFGTPLGLKLALLVYHLCAMHGAYVLGRDLGLSKAGALVAGLGFGGCGWFVMHLSSGHINFAGATLYPYMLVAWRRALDPARGWYWLVPAGAVVAWMAGLGGTYTAPMGAVLLGVVAATESVRRRSVRPLVYALLVGGIALGVCAWRMLPTLEFATDHPRHVVEKDGNEVLDLVRAFFAWRNTLAPVAGHVYWWHEYCCHLAYLVLVLAAVGALRGATRRDLVPLGIALAWALFRLALPKLDVTLSRFYGYRDLYWWLWTFAGAWAMRRGPGRALVPVLLVSLGIAVGRAWPYGPWWLLRKLPLYGDLRVPSRYLVLAAIPIVVWAGQGLEYVLGRLAAAGRERLARRLAWAAVAIVGVESIIFGAPAWYNVFIVEQEAPASKVPFYQIEGDRRWMFTAVLEGHGILQCDEEAPLQRAEALDVGPVEQVRLLDPAAGSATLERWSPNELRLAVDLTRPTVVMVNQNWNEHWRVAPGEGDDVGRVEPLAGRLAVRIDRIDQPGRRTITLRYRPRSFVVGAWVSAIVAPLGLAAFVLGAWRRRRKASQPAG